MTTGTVAVLTFCAAVVFIAVIGIARSAYLLREERDSAPIDADIAPPPEKGD